jgi:hypothetical protein
MKSLQIDEWTDDRQRLTTRVQTSGNALTPCKFHANFYRTKIRVHFLAIYRTLSVFAGDVEISLTKEGFFRNIQPFLDIVLHLKMNKTCTFEFEGNTCKQFVMITTFLIDLMIRY